MRALNLVSLASAAILAAAYDNGAPQARLPAMGWSSWVALGPGTQPVFDYCSEKTLKEAIDAFIDVGLYDAGWRSVHSDDCWAGGRYPNGTVYADPTRFPNGMEPVVSYARSKGLVFGLYTCAGTETCVGGRPGSSGYWEQDANSYASWGVQWVKMDFCNTNGPPQPYYQNMSKALNATGVPITFNMCEWGVDNPWEWGDEIAQSWRATGDHTATWDSTKSIIAQSAAIPRNYSGRPYGWNDLDMLETGCYEQCAHANGKQANMTATEYKTEFSMWAISASPLVFTAAIMNCTGPAAPVCNVSLVQQYSKSECTAGVSYGCLEGDNTTMYTQDGCRGEFLCNGNDVVCNINGTGQHTCSCVDPDSIVCKGWISDLQKEILLNTEVIAINQDVTPQGTPVNPGDLTVWARMLSDGSAAVAFYNQDDTPADISMSFSSIGWPSGTSAAVRDLWAHQDLGTFTDRYPASGAVTVAPHETLVFRMTKQ